LVKRSQFDFNLFRSMEVFAAIVETRQVTRAAHVLGITQSAASQHLRALEEALGSKLVDRSSRPMDLTRAGISLHRRAAHILNEIEDLKTDLHRLDKSPMPQLRIGILPSIATTLAPMLVGLARRRFGIPELTMFAALANDHQDLLRNRRADMVITSDALYDVDGLERHHLMREAFMLVTPADYDGPTDELTRLAEHLPLVRFSADTPVGRRTNQHLRRVRQELPRTIEADRSSLIVAAVDAGQGFALLTPTLLLDGIAEGMNVTVSPLPVAGFNRTLTLVARQAELGTMPMIAAAEIATSLQSAIGARFAALPQGAVDFVEHGSNGDY
jgi:DNA-binding transcriptional LysR family regulator